MSLLGTIGGLAAQAIQQRYSGSTAQNTKQMPMRIGPQLQALPGGAPTRGFGGGGFMTAAQASAAFYKAQGKRKRRRTNPTNVHALRRALRRVEGFVKLEKRVDKIVNRLSRSKGRANRSGFVRKSKR
jgi:hypothetical protein